MNTCEAFFDFVQHQEPFREIVHVNLFHVNLWEGCAIGDFLRENDCTDIYTLLKDLEMEHYYIYESLNHGYGPSQQEINTYGNLSSFIKDHIHQGQSAWDKEILEYTPRLSFSKPFNSETWLA
jgi:hypothetical protein